MKKYYKTLGLEKGASQKAIQSAFERLSKELSPDANDHQEFFVEEYKKVCEAYDALSNSTILATKEGAKQVFEKPTPSPKIKSVSPKKPGTETPKKTALKKRIIFSIAVFSLAIIAYKIYYSPKTYERSEIVFNKDRGYVKKDMSLLNGRINDRLYKGEFVNGMRKALHCEWHANGQLVRDGSYVNGKREGLHREWHANGQLERDGSYVNGKREGLWRTWYENGQLVSEGNYLKSEKEGLWRTWYENGQIKLKGSHANGEKEGLWRTWHENGQLEIKGSYANGEREGWWRTYDESGYSAGLYKYIDGKKV